MTSYAAPEDIPTPYRAKLVVIYARGLKIYGQIPYLLAKRLEAQFISNEISIAGGGSIWGGTAEPNWTVVPSRRDDGQPHTPETLQALIDWLQADKGFVATVATPEYYYDRLDSNWGRQAPRVFQPTGYTSDSQTLLALIQGKFNE